MHCDLFCNVIDNFGDIGVAWRLARQLDQEKGWRMRLWVDDLKSFARIQPGIDANAARQTIGRVEVVHWVPGVAAPDAIADVVIEAFGCALPHNYQQAMAERQVAPVWINLEYLSAESWVEGCHALPSPHPRLPLTKHFFFPGFGEKTGGVICEEGLTRQRERWQADTASQAAWWQARGINPRQDAERWVSLFCYENAAVTPWLQHLAESDTRWRVLVPASRVLADVARALGQEKLAAGDSVNLGNLQVDVLPFTDQAGFDRLLWSCDVNIVRGEDSFMRAQWAARPFLWHIYPQDEDAHMVKLDAFLARFTATLDGATRDALVAAQHAFNRHHGLAEHWDAFIARTPALARHGWQWADQQLVGGDLATRLVHFCENRLQ
ncbi:elongation factor P maturation arginine rhamnosyltransferase EarP [Crenobacter caeni]|uniref:elongation factor P maturation arginine rhamnosyltransferase EarP n=1 Tax=Crenobacter caeni TaxID=2705474 RepID=UPI0032C46532